MAGSNRRFTLAVVLLPLLFLAMSGLARANDIIVNTTDGDSDPAPLCTLPDAILAHNLQTAFNGCGAGNGSDTIVFGVTGTISIDETLEITNGALEIEGPPFGCSGPGPCGITVNGEGSVQIIEADSGTTVSLFALTFENGFASTSSAGGAEGGAIFANGTDLEIDDCLFVDNTADDAPIGDGGAIFINAGTVNIVNSTFADNTAKSVGGAIADPGSSLTITNCTFYGNSATTGGALGSATTKPKIKGTIFANSTSGKNCSTSPVSPNSTDENCNISDDASCAFSKPQSVNSSTTLHLDPAGLENNGGPTETIALEAGSDAINRIPVANCTDQQATPQPLETDQRLFGRPDPSNLNYCDSGAYEVDAVPPFTLNSERVQIARSSSPNSDQVNMGLTFTENGDPDCDADEDALNDGVGVFLIQGTCADLPDRRTDSGAISVCGAYGQSPELRNPVVTDWAGESLGQDGRAADAR